MWQYNELYHHGIKGQKWGVRRFQNEDGSLTSEGQKRYGESGKKISSKEYYSEKRELTKNLEKKDPRREKLRSYETEMESLMDRYDFDQDDGGGGTTKADQKAGRRYWELTEKHQELSDQIEAQAKADAGKILAQKYGANQVKRIETVSNIKAGITAVAVMAPILAMPVFFALHDSKK